MLLIPVALPLPLPFAWKPLYAKLVGMFVDIRPLHAEFPCQRCRVHKVAPGAWRLALKNLVGELLRQRRQVPDDFIEPAFNLKKALLNCGQSRRIQSLFVGMRHSLRTICSVRE